MGLIVFFVIKAARKTKTIKDFALGSGFSPITVGLSLAASITSAATFIINPGFVAVYGWSAFLALSVMVPLGLYISLIIMSKSFLKYGAHIKALTLAQWVGKRYNSPGFSIIMGLLSLLLITFIVLICVGITKVLASALEINQIYVLAGLIIFVFGYIMFGGANSMVYTNTIQAILMIIVATILLTSGFSYFEDGIKGFWDSLSAVDENLVGNFNTESPLFRDWFEVIFCNFIIGIAIVCQPHIITKSLMLKSENDVNKYLFVAIVTESLFFMVLFVGLFARLQFPDLTLNGNPIKLDEILSVYVVQKFTVGLGIIVILGLVSAGLSTLEGIIQSLSITITNDIIKPIVKISDESPHLISTNKIVILVLGVITFFVSYQQLLYPNLSVAILAQNGVYAFFSAAFVPVLFGIFFKDVNKWAVIVASMTAIVVHFSVYYGQLSIYTTGTIKNPAVAGTYAILSASLVGTIIYLTSKRALFNKSQ